MTIEGLNYIKSLMAKLNIPYEFMEWTAKVPNTYWVGEYTESDPDSEGGKEQSTFIITGTTNKSYVELETVKERIKREIGNGLTAILANGAGIAVLYNNSYPVPSVEYGVHRMQINLEIKEWKGE